MWVQAPKEMGHPKEMGYPVLLSQVHSQRPGSEVKHLALEPAPLHRQWLYHYPVTVACKLTFKIYVCMRARKVVSPSAASLSPGLAGPVRVFHTSGRGLVA